MKTLENILGNSWKKNYWFLCKSAAYGTNRYTPMKSNKAYLLGAYYFGSCGGKHTDEVKKLIHIYAVPNHRTFNGKFLTSTNKYYHHSYLFDDIINYPDVIEVTDLAQQLADTHKFLDFRIVHYQKRYIKCSFDEFTECIRNLHRRGIRNGISYLDVTGDSEMKLWMANIPTTISKNFLMFISDTSEFTEYVHQDSILSNEEFSHKDGFLVFVKDGGVDRFLLMYHTTKKLELDETQVIDMNRTYNNFLSKIIRKSGIKVIKIVAFKDYRGIINEKEYLKYTGKRPKIGCSYITDYECTDILSKAKSSETCQVLDIATFYKH